MDAFLDPDQIMGGISQEIESALKAMSKAETAEEKVRYSEVVKNLSESVGVFLNWATDLMDDFGMDDFDFDDEDEDED